MDRVKPIKDFPNYSVSDEGFILNQKTGHMLTPVLKNGYYGVRLSNNSKVTYKSLHLLVYDAFNGDRIKGMHIDHIDGVRTNNHLSNLRQVTPEQNNSNRKHLIRGEYVNTSKLSPTQVMEIRQRKSVGENSNDLAKEYGITKSAINRVATGKTWAHLPILSVDNSVWSDPRLTGAISGKSLRERYGADYFSEIAKNKKFKRHCASCTCSE